MQTPEFPFPYINIKAFEKGIVDEYTNGEGCVMCKEGDFLMVSDVSRSGYGRANLMDQYLRISELLEELEKHDQSASYINIANDLQATISKLKN